MILCGDLNSLATCADDARLQPVTDILNCAALASFAWKPEVWKVNVEHSSRFVSRVARLPCVQRFLQVGTAMISGDARNCTIREDEVLDGRRQLVPYTQSKAAFEMRLPSLLGYIPLVVTRWAGDVELKRLAGAVRIYQVFAGLDVCFDNARLRDEGMMPPPRFTDYIEVCIKTGQDMPIVEQMQYDFR